jgi:hypothetical protein
VVVVDEEEYVEYDDASRLAGGRRMKSSNNY